MIAYSFPVEPLYLHMATSHTAWLGDECHYLVILVPDPILPHWPEKPVIPDFRHRTYFHCIIVKINDFTRIQGPIVGHNTPFSKEVVVWCYRLEKTCLVWTVDCLCLSERLSRHTQGLLVFFASLSLFVAVLLEYDLPQGHSDSSASNALSAEKLLLMPHPSSSFPCIA